jgi:transposase
MEPQSGGIRKTYKTYKYRLSPTPAQAQVLETVLSRCRMLYNVALEQRKTWWDRGQGQGATYYQQKAELPDVKAACPELAEVNAQVLQDVILRVERAYQDFFRRIKDGRDARLPALPRQGALYQFHLSAVWWWRGAGWQRAEPLEDWTHPHPHAPSTGRHPQDRHD